jgi:hypothetical protein
VDFRRHQDQPLAVGERGSSEAADGPVEKALILIELYDVIARSRIGKQVTPRLTVAQNQSPLGSRGGAASRRAACRRAPAPLGRAVHTNPGSVSTTRLRSFSTVVLSWLATEPRREHEPTNGQSAIIPWYRCAAAVTPAYLAPAANLSHRQVWKAFEA